MEDADIIRKAIINPTLDLSAISRFCLACRTGMIDLASHFFERAMSLYLACPNAYDAVYGDLLPQEFRVAARERLG